MLPRCLHQLGDWYRRFLIWEGIPQERSLYSLRDEKFLQYPAKVPFLVEDTEAVRWLRALLIKCCCPESGLQTEPETSS